MCEKNILFDWKSHRKTEEHARRKEFGEALEKKKFQFKTPIY